MTPHCVVCGEGLDDVVVRCLSCSSSFHHDCWEYNSGCGIFGCQGDKGEECSLEDAVTSSYVSIPGVLPAKFWLGREIQVSPDVAPFETLKDGFYKKAKRFLSVIPSWINSFFGSRKIYSAARHANSLDFMVQSGEGDFETVLQKLQIYLGDSAYSTDEISLIRDSYSANKYHRVAKELNNVMAKCRDLAFHAGHENNKYFAYNFLGRTKTYARNTFAELGFVVPENFFDQLDDTFVKEYYSDVIQKFDQLFYPALEPDSSVDDFFDLMHQQAEHICSHENVSYDIGLARYAEKHVFPKILAEHFSKQRYLLDSLKKVA